MAGGPPLLEHLHRRAGFGLTKADAERLGTGRPYRELVDELLVFDQTTVDVDSKIGTPGYVGITTQVAFTPNRDINHARQRWLFRMVHAAAPFREKMALVLHHHFATAFSKISDAVTPIDAARLMDAKPGEDVTQQLGQIELFRQRGLGSFRDLLVDVARDPAMLIWLDGQTNKKGQPQENFGRELMELFTFGVEHYTESDVYAAARVFTGWNLRQSGARGTGGTAGYSFRYNPDEHETSAKEFSFPIYSHGSSTPNRIPARSAANGYQDGIDLIHALAYHPETARRLARRLWTWFVSETEVADPGFVNDIARTYLENDTNMRAVMRAVFMSRQFQDPRYYFQRYAWPTEFVVRMLREVGYVGFSLNDAVNALVNMGQQLYEPPDVNGWEVGPGWFSTGGMLTRMNFASTLATSQRVALREIGRPFKATPESLVDGLYDLVSLPEPASSEYAAIVNYVKAGGTWTGSEAQLLTKCAGVMHLLTGSGEYQFV